MGDGSFVSNAAPRGVIGSLVLLALLLGLGCESDNSPDAVSSKNTLSLDVDEVLADTSYRLVTQDSTTVAFPDAYAGTPILLGTIYTHCPNVCPKITANMKDIRAELADTVDVQFVSITFDPIRDTPSRLAAYRAKFGLDATSWQFLTGDSTTIRRLMDRLDVRHTVKGTDDEFPAEDRDSAYVYTHSNQITLLDGHGRVRAEYGGSQTPPELIVKDLKNIQL